MGRLPGMASLMMCVVLACLTKGAFSQTPPTVITFDLYIFNMTYDAMDDIVDKTSGIYNRTSSEIKETLSPIGGESDDIIFSNGGGCLKVHVVWKNGNDAAFYQMMKALEQQGIRIWLQTWAVSFNGCPAQTLLRVTFFVVEMTYSDKFKDQNSAEYLQVKQDVVNSGFSNLGSGIQALEIRQNSGCVEIYVEIETGKSASIIDLMSQLNKNGITLMGQNHTVQSQPCSDNSTAVVRFRFYVANLTWSDKFQDRNSTEFQDMKQTVEVSFAGLGGGIRALEIAQNSGCTEFYVEWNALNSAIMFDLMSSLKTSGFKYRTQNYDVQSTPCAPPGNATVLRFKFYVASLTWSDNFQNRNSTEFQALKQTVEVSFAGLGGNIRALEITKSSGCVEFYVEIETVKSASIIDLMSRLNKNGITLMGQSHTVQSQPCSDNSTAVVRFKFYVANLTWSDNFQNRNSTEFQDMKKTVEVSFAGFGGSIRALEIAQNSGCTEFYVEWNALNSAIMFDLMSSLKTSGFNYRTQNYDVQSTPCATPGNTAVVRFNFYVANLTWSDNFKNRNSTEFQEMKQTVEVSFSGLGGSIRAFEIAQNSGCTEFYVEWNALNSAIMFDLMSSLKTSGFNYRTQNYDVQSTQCATPGNTTVVRFTFYLANLTLSDNFQEGNSEYQKLKQTVENIFTGLGGNIRNLVIVKHTGCTEFYVEWNALNSAILFDLMSTLKTNGFTYEFKNYAVESKSCTAPAGNATVVRFRFYVASLTWSDNFQNRNSTEFQALKQTVEVSFAGLGGSIHALEIAKSSGCVEFYVEWNALNPGIMFDLISLLKTNGFTYEFQNYAVQSSSCTGQTTVLRYNFYVVDMMYSSNFANQSSQEYQLVKQIVQAASADLGGSIRNLEIAQNYGCTVIYVEWETNNPTNIMNLMSSLLSNGIHIIDQHYTVQSTPCTVPQADINACPKVTGSVGSCMEACGDFRNCSDGFKCCSNGCGHTCQRVGYVLMIRATIVTNKTWEKDMEDETSLAFMEMKLAGKLMIQMLNSKNPNVFKDVELMEISRILRADGQNYTKMDVEVYLTQDLPNAELKSGSNGVRNTALDLLGVPVNIVSIDWDNNSNVETSMCDKNNCSGICKILRSGEEYCSCDPGYTGAGCNIQETTDVCALGLCINGGTCHNMPGGTHHCECPDGFSGSVCQDAANHCREGQPLMTSSGEATCFRGQQCPTGFMCNVDPSDRWTACCFDKGFLCDNRNLCQAGGECVADFMTGKICRCPPGRLGVFCEKAGNAPLLTECQQRQQFGDLVVSILQTGTSQLNVTLQDMQQILQHLDYEYYPTVLCDEQGEYKATTQGIQVANPSSPTVDICLDKSGNYDPTCTVAVCEILTVNNLMEFCFNGGRCLGDITQKLCDCTGTGYHGARCELPGEGGDTDCTSRQDVAYLTIGALNGTIELMPGFGKDLIANTAKSILAYAKMDNIFVPYCDNDGKFEYRGCTYMVNDTSRKTCSCATEDGSNYGEEKSTVDPPWNCIEGPNSCPPEWGSDCEKPIWWCTDKVQCNRKSERCAFFTQCTNSFCKQEPEVKCVDKNKVLACDPQPCTDDPYSKCKPCEAQGTCYNVGTATNSDSINYRCECNLGYSGTECEINDTFCGAIPKGLCKSHCIGDISSGQLCHCGIGYGGVFCDKPARTPCQRRKALFDDIINFISKKATWSDVARAQMEDLVKYITKLDGGDEIPVLNCTATGFYEKVQCMVATNNMNDKQCNCVDYNGNYINSNVKAYIGYDICTAPSDFQELAESACSVPAQFGLPESSPCDNGGECVFDMYAGKFCSCPSGYSGMFCQTQGHDSITAQSLCGLYSGAWEVLHTITTGRPAWIVNDVQRQIYLNITQSFLMSQKNESWALKVECKNDGTFKPVQCFYNVKTGEMGSCYCWNPIGLLTENETPVSSTDSDICSARSACPMYKCVPCEHGYRQDNLGCQTCNCKNPCEEMLCGVGQRCVIETSMVSDTRDSCTKAVCRPANKQGTCPGYANSTLPTTSGNDGSCIVDCHDDTDCDGAKKCCGQCSRVCVLPQDVDRCLVPHSTQRCQDYTERYYYNSTTKRCEKFIFGGCSPDLNNFESFQDCCNNCSKGQCKKGQCPAIKPGEMGACVDECSADADCAGQLICCSNGCGHTCVMPDGLMVENSNCLSRQMEAMRSQNLRMEANIDGCNVWNIPVCEQNGTWAREQCQVALGICWCVSPNGNYINNTITRGPAQCQKVLESTMMEADLSKIDMSGVNFPVCDKSMDFHCCPKSVCSQTCTAYPGAVCRINPCGGCKAEFYNAEGKMVNCSQGLSPCQYELGLVTSTATNGKGYPEQCKLKPDTSDCRGYQLQWYFDPATARCNQFVWGMCDGNANRFNTPEECYGICAPTLSPCLNVSCDNVSTTCKLGFVCQTTQKICELTPVCAGSAVQKPYMGKNPFVPSCDAAGGYSYKQCYGTYCWCTDSQGQYINGLTTEQTSNLTCSANGALQSINSTNGVCPNGNQPNMNCVKACTGKMCLRNPTAKCVADLCSANCSTKFVNAQDQEVACADEVPCPGTRVEACPESICDVALKQNCSRNPCAVCMVDPCTCQAYFVDARTHKKLTAYQCSYFTMGLCEVDACNILSSQEKAKISKLISSNTNINLPECEADGIYKPKQCQSQSSCRCVNQYGETIKESPDGSCKPIDKIRIINMTFTYDADFNSFKSNNELNLFRTKFMAKLSEVGIDTSIIKFVGEPYQGSIKMNVTIECNPESCDRDLALIADILKKLKLDNNGELDLLVNGKTVKLMDITNETRTESQVAQESNSKSVDTAGGLSETEKIIIGVVCGAVGLLVLGIIAYCLCCRRRSQKKELDTSSEHSRSSTSSPTYHKSEPVYNKAFEEDSVIVKERL